MLKEIIEEIKKEKGDVYDYITLEDKRLVRHWNNCIDVILEILQSHMGEGESNIVTINTDNQEEYENKLKYYLDDGYELKSCSCGYYGIASDSCYPYWMAVLVR